MANSRAAGAPRHAPRRRSRRIHHSRTSTRTSDSQCDLCRHQFVFHRPTAVPTVSRPHPLSRSIQPLLLAGVRSFHSQICLQEFSCRGFWLQTIERLSGFRSRSTVDCEYWSRIHIIGAVAVVGWGHAGVTLPRSVTSILLEWINHTNSPLQRCVTHLCVGGRGQARWMFPTCMFLWHFYSIYEKQTWTVSSSCNQQQRGPGATGLWPVERRVLGVVLLHGRHQAHGGPRHHGAALT
jgi:hypothetical protein